LVCGALAVGAGRSSGEKAARILGSLGEAAAGAVDDLTSLLRDSNPDVRLVVAKSVTGTCAAAD
jgi:hypothetical protein